MKLFIDTETTGFPKFQEPLDHPEQPHLVQLAAILTDERGKEVSSMSVVINNPGIEIPEGASKVHGISTDFASKNGVSPLSALTLLYEMLLVSSSIAAHNIEFDIFIIKIAIARHIQSLPNADTRDLDIMKKYCTMRSSMDLPGLPLNHAGRKKFPKLSELYHYAFGEDFDNAHDAMADCRAMMRVYWWLKEKGL